MKDFGFYSAGFSDVVLSDGIEICDDEEGAKNEEFIVANSPKLKAQIYAPQINFYIANSKDEPLVIAQNVDILYEAAAAAFDGALYSDHQKPVGKNVILACDEPREELVALLKQHGFKVIALSRAEIKFVYGEIGDLSVSISGEDDEFEVQSDFFLVRGAQAYQLRQSGCYEISGLKDGEILEILQSKSPVYRYRNSTIFDPAICQYQGRRNDLCAKCVEVCPTVAILKNDEKRELVFSHIDCIGCGECVSVCPSGALKFAPLPQSVFYEISKLYKGKIPLLIAEGEISSALKIELPCGVLPFGIFGSKQIDEVNLLSAMQESGSSVIVYGADAGEGTREAVELINGISRAIYGKDAVFLARNLAELQEALGFAQSAQPWGLSINEQGLSKKEIFSKRVSAMVGEGSFGTVKSGERLRFGEVSINESSCTLCLSCVGACNTGALYADNSDNSIKFNASLCTTCNYCVLSCAEKDTMALNISGVRLAPEFFTYRVLAKDELFKCIECGKEFATTKAVMKIADMMGAHFSSEPEKMKTLFCCGDCKAKIMIKKQIEDARKGAM
ncbi:4Fe-4S binding protein [uncultured Campylobacter sp.]|uniref:4Fe-4S dicluster domain-containing protein n=1 Tax=uncultured Campylobacter sp. TaxID=218934 RepID=UPI00262A7529|nr:4Fe-4S binding protein [uncultured Campylobacter sp.]